MDARIHITNLDASITQEHIHDLFITFGPISEVELPTATLANKALPTQGAAAAERKVGNKGWADVQFESEGDADAALDNMEGFELLGRVLRVRKAVKAGGNGSAPLLGNRAGM
jgi:RNA recognition motif-containing protein